MFYWKYDWICMQSACFLWHIRKPCLQPILPKSPLLLLVFPAAISRVETMPQSNLTFISFPTFFLACEGLAQPNELWTLVVRSGVRIPSQLINTLQITLSENNKYCRHSLLAPTKAVSGQQSSSQQSSSQSSFPPVNKNNNITTFFISFAESELVCKANIVDYSRIFEMIGYSISFASILGSLIILSAFR